MLSDGADLNISAKDSLKIIMGSEEEPVQSSDEEFEHRIRTAVLPSDSDEEATEDSYSGMCDYVARIVLEFLEAHPEHQEAPMESTGVWKDATGREMTLDEACNCPNMSEISFVSNNDGIFDLVGDALKGLGLTGFMAGWGVNAARHILKLKAQQNPAIQ